MTRKPSKVKAPKLSRKKKAKPSKPVEMGETVNAQAEKNYGPNVQFLLYTAQQVRIRYWDHEAKSVLDVLERQGNRISGECYLAEFEVEELVKNIGNQIEGQVEFSQGGYGPWSAPQPVAVLLRDVKVVSRGRSTNGVTFEIEIR